MAIDLNFEGVSRGGFLVDEGENVLTIAEAEFKKKEGKDPVLHVTFEAGDKKFMQFFSTHPKAIWSLRDFLEAVYDTILEGNLTFEESELIGRQVIGIVTHVPRQDKPGQMNNEVSKYSPLA